MRKLAFLALTVALVSGCGVVYTQPVFEGNLLDKANVDQLKQGMTREQVVQLLGTPTMHDPFHQSRWDYIGTARRGHHHTEVKDLTLWFENDALSKWEGEYFPEQDEALSKEMARFGNLPKDKDKGKRGGGYGGG
jgi:outer membrane protein assembly factor BamE